MKLHLTMLPRVDAPGSDLVKAAALILAEIERLDRAAEPKPEVK